MAYPLHVLEEELKNKLANDFFRSFDSTKIIGRIDFCISKKIGNKSQGNLFDNGVNVDTQSFLWAEAKKGNKLDIKKSLVQLIFTIGKERTHEKYLPPIFIGAFDAEKIVFIKFSDISEVLFTNDFNWKVPPSDHTTKEFKQLASMVEKSIEQNMLFKFGDNDNELKIFIKNNFILGHMDLQQVVVTKNNFSTVYLKWLKAVKPTIDLDWNLAEGFGIVDADFYLADLLSEKNQSLKENLFVLLKSDKYELNRKVNELGMETVSTTKFKDKQKAYFEFWNIYKRPPKKEYWDYIVKRRDLLVPQDVRERKGSFFTPAHWVELS